MNLKALRAFTLVMELGSLTAAADQLHLSTSAVSRLIAQLEGETRLKLFTRAHRGLLPTEAAHLFIKEAQRILADMEELPAVLENIRRGTFQRLRMIVTPRLVPGLAVPAIAAFAERHPDVKCVLDVQPKWDLERSLATHRYDLGLAIMPVAGADIRAIPLYRIQSEALLPSGHRLAKKRALAPSDLSTERIIGLLPGQLIRRQLNELAHTAGVDLDVALETSSTQVAAEFVRHGCGISVGDRLLLSGLAMSGVTTRPFDPPLWTTTCLLLPHGEALSNHAETFVACLKDTLQQFAGLPGNRQVIELFRQG